MISVGRCHWSRSASIAVNCCRVRTPWYPIIAKPRQRKIARRTRAGRRKLAIRLSMRLYNSWPPSMSKTHVYRDRHWRVRSGPAVSKNKSYFANGPWLVVIHACGSEDKTWRRVNRVHPRKISTKEESFVLEGGCHSERRARAAWTENQVDCLVVGAPRAGDVFPAPH